RRLDPWPADHAAMRAGPGRAPSASPRPRRSCSCACSASEPPAGPAAGRPAAPPQAPPPRLGYTPTSDVDRATQARLDLRGLSPGRPAKRAAPDPHLCEGGARRRAVPDGSATHRAHELRLSEVGAPAL